MGVGLEKRGIEVGPSVNESGLIREMGFDTVGKNVGNAGGLLQVGNYKGGP